MSGKTDDLSHKIYGGLFRDLEECFKWDSLLKSSSQGLSTLTCTLPFDPYNTINSPSFADCETGSGDLPKSHSWYTAEAGLLFIIIIIIIHY